ncbi:MAG: protein-disulfide reductase DsbD family protein [Chloroherpetonaceae bacterium]|nr:protein-disulfide reductase DsbD family protein [Chloroherpetonaceae bacterium]MDW8437508.1 protein-disulfide reductase DsbD family protein [Chloroherpetonaceae bacterium]
MRLLPLIFLATAPTMLNAQLLNGKTLVTPSLHLGTTDFGKPFTIAIRFQIAPEWHLYWKNPGDAGLAPKVKWTLPEGFVASEPRFPTPRKIVAESAVDYGYDDELILLATISPPKNATKPVVLKAELSWLVCRESCVPGEATLELDAATLSENDRAEANRLIERAQRQLPEPLAKTNATLESATATAQGGKTLLTLRFSGDDAKRITDFFPEEIEGFVPSYAQIKVTDGVATIPLAPASKDAKLAEVRGLAMMGEKGYEVVATVRQAERSGGLLDQTFKTEGGEKLSLWWALLFAFIGGLILNVMPCVLPVISLKAMSLVDQAGEGASRSVLNGLMFAFGALLSFWALALVVVLLQRAGAQVGWGFQFQSPAFVVAMSVVMFVFGLNLLGAFEISAPSLSGEVSKTLLRRDALGALMNGVLATTLATPCTAPFLGSALGFAFSQPAPLIFAVFTTIGLGLAAPYLVFAVKPQWLKFIPKPGEWTIRFKQAMSFLLFATVVWLLSVMGSQLGAEGVVATVALLLGVGVSAWLVGSFIDLESSAPRKATVWSVAILVALLSYYVAFERYLDWRNLDAKAYARAKSSGGIEWQEFSLELVERNVRSGKPVFIDFTAEWCFTCKVTEQTVLETDEVREAIERLGVVPVKADWTNRNDEIAALLKKFGRSGVPLYVVFPAGKLDEPIVLPEVITKEMLLKALEKAAPALSVKK